MSTSNQQAVQQTTRQAANRRLAIRLALMGIAMFGFGYAMVPLYDVFCELTGLGGRVVQTGAPQAGESGADTAAQQRLIIVEFVANLNIDAPWEFRPANVKMQVHPGQFYQTSYQARNLTEQEITGQAVYNVAPPQAARYLRKIECFCFTQQLFGPKESKDMPLAFQIDPDLPPEITTITLSYTFFRFAADS